MINYIIFGLLAAIFAVSLMTVTAEYFVPKNTAAGRALRAVRIRLREKSRTSFCVTAAVLLIFGLVAHDNFKWLFAALGVMLLTLIVLHPGDFISIFRHRRKASRKKRLGLTPTATAKAREAKPAKVLEPIVVEAEEGKE